MKKLTEEIVRQIPELLKTKSQHEVAKMFGVAQATIFYWVKQYRKAGVEIIPVRKANLMSKIINNDTKIELPTGQETAN